MEGWRLLDLSEPLLGVSTPDRVKEKEQGAEYESLEHWQTEGKQDGIIARATVCPE